MSVLREIENPWRKDTYRALVFHCPGCDDNHMIDDGWKWNGEMDGFSTCRIALINFQD